MSTVGFIFLHGFLGIAETNVFGLTFEYFRGLRDVARTYDIEIRVPQMPGRPGIDVRTQQVIAAMQEMKADRVALVGVSMGGLVARAVTARHDPERRIRAVATICTPHRGSPVADHSLAIENPVKRWIVGLFSDAVCDLSTEAVREFNVSTPDRMDVSYLSWAASRPANEMPFFLKNKNKLIADADGHNDGLVSVRSATWGELIATEQSDHLEIIGWSPTPADPDRGRPFDQAALWDRVIARCLAKID